MLTEKQMELLSRYVENWTEMLNGDINELLLIIDDAIVDTFDVNGDPSAEGIQLQKIYDEIFENY